MKNQFGTQNNNGLTVFIDKYFEFQENVLKIKLTFKYKPSIKSRTLYRGYFNLFLRNSGTLFWIRSSCDTVDISLKNTTVPHVNSLLLIGPNCSVEVFVFCVSASSLVVSSDCTFLVINTSVLLAGALFPHC